MSFVAKNKMIAIFDGGLNLAKGRLDMFCFEQNPINHKWVSETELDYHQNWNSLIRVAKKIDETGNIRALKLRQAVVTYDITNLYNEVVYFLSWYYKTEDSSVHAI